MKKIITAFTCIIAAVEVHAVEFLYNDIRYEITSIKDLTVQVIKNSSSSHYSGSIIIPANVSYNDKTFTVTGIADYVFVDAGSLTDVFFPKTLVNLGEQLFNNCQQLRSIKIDPENPKYCDIDGVMFTKDKTLILYYPNAKGSEYTLPETTKKIGEFAFAVCWNLKSLTLNAGLEYIAQYSFYYTKELKSISFPLTMKEIEKNAFSRCTKLNQIWVYGEKPFKLAANSFSDEIYLNATLYVPSGTKDVYGLKIGWENFFSIQEFDATGICQCEASSDEKMISIYDINGIQKFAKFNGLNLLKYSNGSIRKVFVR